MRSSKGNEKEDIAKLNKFLDSYKPGPTKEQIAKDIYDDPQYGIVNKTNYSRKQFTDQLTLETMNYYPDTDSAYISFYDHGPAGHHILSTEYSSKTKKHTSTEMNG